MFLYSILMSLDGGWTNDIDELLEEEPYVLTRYWYMSADD
jgi:hypothetical protein